LIVATLIGNRWSTLSKISPDAQNLNFIQVSAMQEVTMK
jgi:hypothetical protein